MQKNPKFVSSKQTAPKQADIDNTIVRIKGRLAEKPINRHCNAARDTRRRSTYSKTVLPTSLSRPSATKTVQGRAIAACAIDYLQGWCSAETLCGVPIKKM